MANRMLLVAENAVEARREIVQLGGRVRLVVNDRFVLAWFPSEIDRRQLQASRPATELELSGDDALVARLLRDIGPDQRAEEARMRPVRRWTGRV